MRTFYFVVILTVLMSGCTTFRSATDDSRKCRGSLMDDCFNSRKDNFAKDKPNPESEWGIVFIRTKSLQVSLARRKAFTFGCRKAAEEYHAQSALIERTGRGKYEHSGCDLVATDVYPEKLGETTLYRIEAWVGIPIGETARRWQGKIRSRTH